MNEQIEYEEFKLYWMIHSDERANEKRDRKTYRMKNVTYLAKIW